MKISTPTLVFMASVLFLATVVVSGYEEAAETPAGQNKSLKQFLEDDLTSMGVYNWNDYHCVHFSVDLAENLTVAGYDATPVILGTCRPGEWSHMVVSVNLGNETVYIEPRNDVIFSPFDWHDEIALGDEVEYVNVSVAKSMRS